MPDVPAAVAPFTAQGRFSDPGAHGPALDALPRDIGALCSAISGLLIHDYYHYLHNVSFEDGIMPPRETKPLADRLGQILERDPRPLHIARLPGDRTVGTCRDFALMLCGTLRRRGVPARVRCGFAAYFGRAVWDDHWICDYWQDAKGSGQGSAPGSALGPADGRWARADAQLDAAHRAHLGIAFDIADLPEGAFLTGAEAWRACRAGDADPAAFRAGDAAAGLWILGVNLARDALAIAGREVTDWDGWRGPKPADRVLDAPLAADFDTLADELETGPPPPPARLDRLAPPWI